MPGPFARPIGAPPGNLGSSSFTDDVETGPPGARISSTRFGTARTMAGRMTIVVGDAPLTGVVLRLQPFGRLDGRVQFEYDPTVEKPAQPPFVILRAEPVDGSPALGLPRGSTDREDPSRPFSVEGIQPGAYLVRGSSGQWRIKSITAGGRDYTSAPFDFTTTPAFDDVVVTMTNVSTSLSGSARDAQSAPAVGVRVVVFPAEREQWTHYGMSPPRIRSALTNNLAGYRIERLPAGDYFVAAIPASIRSWRGEGAAFFERIVSSARRVTVRWGEPATLDLLATEVAR
jgi:hypothetical protein